MGITVYIGGNYYWFENTEVLIELLDENCDDKGPSEDNALTIEYDED